MHSSVDRRDFLKGVATAASVSVMARATAKGTAANTRIKAGVVGLGGRGTMIAKMLHEHGGYEITAVADYFPEVSEKAVERFGVDKARCFSGLLGYQRLLETDVDAVFLETPPYCFPDHVEAAVAAGRHVYMAKPVACDVPGCLRVAAAAKEAQAKKQVFLVDFQTRTDAFIIEGIKRVRDGEIGAIGLLSSIYTDESFPDKPLEATVENRLRHLVWVNDNALGGSYLVNAGIHAIDVALWLAGATPVSAVGASRIVRANPQADSHDAYSLTYEFADGLLLNHRGELLKNQFGFHRECRAQCQAGRLDTGYAGNVVLRGIRTGWPGGEVKNLYAEGARRNIATFHRSVLEGDSTNPTVEPSINANLATILGREAGERRTRITWEQMLAENRRVEPDLTGLTA